MPGAAVIEGHSGQKHEIGNIQKTTYSKVRQKVLFYPCGIFEVSTHRGVKEEHPAQSADCEV